MSAATQDNNLPLPPSTFVGHRMIASHLTSHKQLYAITDYRIMTQLFLLEKKLENKGSINRFPRPHKRVFHLVRSCRLGFLGAPSFIVGFQPEPYSFSL